MNKQYFVYILASYKHGTLYTGIISDLSKRILQHKEKFYPQSFTAKYNINKLVYYEIHEDPYEAISREKQIKNLLRIKKIKLIEEKNPNWQDLHNEL
ncbi:MAG: GIY-YIG nuclease family protein [Patescibacteria group bacterium]|nr:GIY-YIG nuclease family protein [Patescibacteria group bacterium]